MSLSEEIVSKIDKTYDQLKETYEKLDPQDYTKSYQKIWFIRAEMEFIVISLKLLNNLDTESIDEKWKEEFSSSLKQVRSEKKIRDVFLDTIELYNKLERIEDILEFYKICWMLKEKLTILLNVVKPKIKLRKNEKRLTKDKQK
ncbi:MAG: hypothetical protein FK731_09690 [Asgard group archaeon]|nr:hypothetical protein [Asgard group archaeon]